MQFYILDLIMSKKTVKRCWSDDYVKYGFALFIDKGLEKAQCMLCYKILGNDSLRPSKLSHHLNTIHTDCKYKDVAFFERKQVQLKHVKLDTSGTFFTQTSASIEASYHVALQIAKQKKAHTIGENLIKPCALKMVELMLGSESCKKLDAIPLSNDTISRRIKEMADDITLMLISELKSSAYGMFSIQLDESTDVANCSQLMVFVRWATTNNIKENILFCMPLETTTKGTDIFQKVDHFFEQHGLKWENLCSVCTDGAQAMLGIRSGFSSMAKKMSPEATSIHCMIHRQALASKTLPTKLESTLAVLIKIVNYVKSSALNTRLFSELCNNLSADYKTLLFHTKVRWLSQGNMLNRVFELRMELIEFFKKQGKDEFSLHLSNITFVQRLAYLADIFEKLNMLNLSMQGRHTNVIKLVDSINSFLQKTANWKLNIQKDTYVMFDRLSSLANATNIASEILDHLSSLENEFKRYFSDCLDMDYKIIRNPFNADPSMLPVYLQDEFIDLKNDSTVKTIFENEELTCAWCKVSQSYPQVGKYVMKMLLPFASTYLCESAFSTLVTLKSKARNRLNVEPDLICAISSFEPRFSILSANKQSQSSS